MHTTINTTIHTTIHANATDTIVPKTLTDMSDYKCQKDSNFGISEPDMEDLLKILGPSNPVKIENRAKAVDPTRILNWLREFKKLKHEYVSSGKSLDDIYKVVSKIQRYAPKKMYISKTFYEQIWGDWLGTKVTKTHEKTCLSYDLDEPNLDEQKQVHSDGHYTGEWPHDLLEDIIVLNHIRGSAGVVNLTPITEPADSCRNKCAFCPHPPKMGPHKSPVSYFPTEPAVARASKVNFYIVEQLRVRIRDLAIAGSVRRTFDPKSRKWTTHCKADIRLAGGTFGHYPMEKQRQFIQETYYAIRTIDYADYEMPPMMSLEEEIEYHVTNDTGVRIVGLSIETRPDLIDTKTLDAYNAWYLTWVEMGVQTTNNDVLKKIQRGHTIEHSEKALSLCKQYGFKTLGHFMQDLPGSTPEIDLQTFSDHLSQHGIVGSVPFAHRWDHLKVYPTLKLPYTAISKWGTDRWNPYSEKKGGKILLDVCCEIIRNLPPSVRIARIFRDFPEARNSNDGLGFESDTMKSNLSQMITERLDKEGVYPKDIRSREVRNRMVDLNRKSVESFDYYCSKGKEHFISIEAPEIDTNKSCLLGLLRLRFNEEPSPCEYVGESAIIREVHIYGNWSIVGESTENTNKVQHRGYGKYLLKVAETMAYIRGYRSIVVISASGTVKYYEKQGYYRHGRYCRKDLNLRGYLRNMWDIRQWN